MIDCLPHIHTVAIHAEAGYESVVPGIGMLCSQDDAFIGVGTYSNSIKKQSNYAIMGAYLGSISSVKLGFMVGAVDGYRPTGFVPLAGGVATLPLSWGAAHLFFTPGYPGLSPAFAQLSFTFKF